MNAGSVYWQRVAVWVASNGTSNQASLGLVKWGEWYNDDRDKARAIFGVKP